MSDRPGRIAVIGAGTMGRVIARDLVEHGFAVTIADIDYDAAAHVAASLGRSATPVHADASDVRSLLCAVRDAQAVVNASRYECNLTVMEACLESRLSYCDLGGLYHVTLKQLALDESFKRRGLLAVVGIGSAPGLTNLMAAYAAERLATMEWLHCYDAYAPALDTLTWAYSIETILDEFVSRPMVFREGRMVDVDPLSEAEPFLFDHGIGYLPCHHTLHSEVATLPFAWPEKGLREMYFKIASFGYTPEIFGQLRLLARLGFAGRDPVTLDADGSKVRIRPRDLLIRLLGRSAAGPAPASLEADPVRDLEEVVTVGMGIASDGRSVRYRVGATAWYHEGWQINAGGLLTGVPPSIVGQWLAEGRLRHRGVAGPERVVQPEPFFVELAKRGIRTTVQAYETLPASETASAEAHAYTNRD